MILRRRFLLAFLPFLTCCGGGATAPPATSTPVAGCGSVPVANEGWLHVAEGSAISYRANPPASGPHYPVWARYQEHATTVARGYWVHNLEHGAIVFLYRPSAPAGVVTALRDAYRALPNDPACGHKRALLTADPDLPTDTAVVAANVVLKGSCVAPNAIRSFALAHRAQAPENICDNGTRP